MIILIMILGKKFKYVLKCLEFTYNFQPKNYLINLIII